MKYFLIIIFLLGGLYGYRSNRVGVPTIRTHIEAQAKEVVIKEVTPTDKEIMHELIDVFHSEPTGIVAKMVYVISHESGFKPTAMNWNCHYYNEKGERYSTSCKKEDRDNAWSVDCGVMQLNTQGKYCPGDLMGYKKNIALGYEKFKRQGIGAWVASWGL